MSLRTLCAGILLAGLCAPVAMAGLPPVSAADLSLSPQPEPSAPVLLSDTPPADQGVYTLPNPEEPGQGANLGGVNLLLDADYFNHYIYRGVDHSIGESPAANIFKTKASTLNLEFNSKLEFDLGKLPHPFVGLFADVYDADPKSRFQEIRPTYGVDWTVKPFTLEGGGNTYIYPNRKSFNTAELYGKVTFDDSFLYRSDKPMLSPYFLGAYDYDKNNGWYLEAGVKHDFVLEDFGLTLTPQADLAYIIGYQEQFVFINELHDTGFQHYDVGLKTTYSLNHLFQFSQRYGEFDVQGFFFYTGPINGELTATSDIWGGVGIGFSY
jgi:hypothetical protein